MLKIARSLHLYLGVLFAPLIMFFAFSGALMVFHWHDSPKAGTYVAPRWIAAIAAIHKSARRAPNNSLPPSRPLKWFVFTMALGLIVTTLLGIYMSFKYGRNPWLLSGLIVVGIGLPMVLLYAF